MKKVNNPSDFLDPKTGRFGYLQQMITFRLSVLIQGGTTSLAEVQLQATQKALWGQNRLYWRLQGLLGAPGVS